jgi:adenosylcobinamide-GDP ribazoletransferase
MQHSAIFASLCALCQREARLFALALAFLSRLGPARAADNNELAAACRWFPAVGLIIGLVAAAPLLVGLFGNHAWVGAWLYVCLNAWITRALHLDGLADVIDAAGSGKEGEGFQAVLKDSRLGAFGAVGLFLALAGQGIGVAALVASKAFAPLIYAPVFGRCLPIALACICKPSPNAGLGAILSAAPRASALGLALLCALGGGLYCLSIAGLAALIAASAVLLWLLTRLARRNDGYNGDFFGAAIASGELLALLAALV